MIRIALLVLHALVAITAIGGAIWVVPTMPLEWIKAGPFEDWTIPALALAFVGMLAAASFGALLVRPWLGALASVVAGAAMIAFELVETAVVGWTLADPELSGYFQAGSSRSTSWSDRGSCSSASACGLPGAPRRRHCH